jgi:hypothetical protein
MTSDRLDFKLSDVKIIFARRLLTTGDYKYFCAICRSELEFEALKSLYQQTGYVDEFEVFDEVGEHIWELFADKNEVGELKGKRYGPDGRPKEEPEYDENYKAPAED